MKSSDFVFVKEKEAFSGVIKIAEKVCNDINLVTGKNPLWIDAENIEKEAEIYSKEGKTLVIFGVEGKSELLNKLGKAGRFNSKSVLGKREVYSFGVFEDCAFISEGKKSVGIKTIVIGGSDKRGTIYGLFRISELMGVSPLVDWADVLPAKQEVVEFKEGVFVSKEPSVRFRGFFINDEWPAFGNWANHNFGGVNANLYEHVFELLLRMKGNYLWPAMWASRFSDDGPDLKNAELADELGVVMGASHHEPCCRAGEEYRYLRGPDSIYGDAWNFRSNKDGITKFWEDGLKRNGKFENVITVGMRGEADTAIMQNATLEDNINLLRDVISTQNKLIKEYVNPDVQQVPRMLALYKEVEPYFYGDKNTKGLMDDPELEGVTLMLCDDNHGNLRTVPTKQMRSHKGGYGMYYHFDYHGSPYSYEWVNTSFLPKVKEQMSAAYEFGIRDLWIVNVGDIMTNEFPLNYFLDLAYDYNTYSNLEFTTEKYTQQWFDKQFAEASESDRKEMCEIVNAYTKLTSIRRTECLQPDTYHPVNFKEADKTLEKAEAIITQTENLYNRISDKLKPGFFLQVYLPACGNMNILRMQIYSGKNRWFASKNAIAANYFAQKVKDCYDYDLQLVKTTDSIDNGKFFAAAWSEHFGFKHWCEAENFYPTYTYVEPTRKNRIVAWVDGYEKTTSGQDWTDRKFIVTDFRNPEVSSVKIMLAACNEKVFDTEKSKAFEIKFNSEEKDCWLTTKTEFCKETNILEIEVSISREKLDSNSQKKEKMTIRSNDGNGAQILVEVIFDTENSTSVSEAVKKSFKKDAKEGEKQNLYLQTTDFISIEAEHFAEKNPGKSGADFVVLPEYGKTLSAVKAMPVTKIYSKSKVLETAPCVVYKFIPCSEGVYAFDFYLNPSNPAFKDNKLQFIAEINGEPLLKNVVDETFAVGDHQEPWSTDITNNIRIASVYADCKEGINELKFYPVTPNVVLEKIVIHEANSKLPQSYLGAPETFRV